LGLGRYTLFFPRSILPLLVPFLVFKSGGAERGWGEDFIEMEEQLPWPVATTDETISVRITGGGGRGEEREEREEREEGRGKGTE
jgi:hypothetical protein